MVLLALLLIAAGGAAAVGLALGGNGAAVDLSAYGYSASDVPVLAVFGLGGVTMFLIMFGTSLLRHAARRSIERKREIEDLRDEHEEHLRRLEDENAALQQELDRSRGRGTFGSTGLHTFSRSDLGPVSRQDDDSWPDGTGRYSPTGEYPRP